MQLHLYKRYSNVSLHAAYNALLQAPTHVVAASRPYHSIRIIASVCCALM